MAAVRGVGTVLRRGLLATGVGAAGGTAWLLSDDHRREQVQRTATFYRTMVPMWAHYRFVEWRVKGRPEAEREAAFTRLHDAYAPRVFDLVVLLRGLYVKLGQVGATRGDFVPQRYLEEFARLQDGVPPEDFAVIRGIIERDLKASLDDLFQWVDPVPLGAASIGQAHAARLKDGTEVVIKVQYPHVRHHFMLDFKTVRWFAEIAQPEFNPIWDELESQFMTGTPCARTAHALFRPPHGQAVPAAEVGPWLTPRQSSTLSARPPCRSASATTSCRSTATASTSRASTTTS